MIYFVSRAPSTCGCNFESWCRHRPPVGLRETQAPEGGRTKETESRLWNLVDQLWASLGHLLAE